MNFRGRCHPDMLHSDHQQTNKKKKAKENKMDKIHLAKIYKVINNFVQLFVQASTRRNYFSNQFATATSVGYKSLHCFKVLVLVI